MDAKAMDLSGWAAFAARHRRIILLASLVTTFAGVGLVIDQPKGTVLEWLALPLLIAGGAALVWAMLPRVVADLVSQPSIANRLLRRITWGGRLIPFFPVLGVAIVLADVGYNLTLSATPALQTEDMIVLLGAGAIFVYRFVPGRFARERDFVVLFSLVLNAILVVPLLLARAVTDDLDRSVDVYSWVALAPQTSAVLTLLGVANSVHPVIGSTAPGLTFVPQHFPVEVTVVITTACSGIYSFGIFASAFIAFVLTEYENMSRKIWALLGMGFVTSYLANVLRMVVIVLVGYYTDTPESDLQNMLIAHSYAGWLIFLAWISIFWAGIFRIFPPTTDVGQAEQPPSRRSKVEPACGICMSPLTPVVPATRCPCGSVFHRRCLAGVDRCPTCGRPQVSGATPFAPG